MPDSPWLCLLQFVLYLPLQIVKDKLLGRGYQGTVYSYCDKRTCVAVKKMYLENRQVRFLKKPFSHNALKYENFIELAVMRMTNELVLQKISPHFILHYKSTFKKREEGACTDQYLYSSKYYNELISGSETFTQWVKNKHDIDTWYNAYFQITTAIYCLQSYFNLTHLDLHSDNILVKRVKPGGVWKYKINGKNYVERVIIKAIKNDIAIYAVHTALDNHKNGVNKIFSDALGLTNTKILVPKQNFIQKLVSYTIPENVEKIRNALFEAGVGKIGNYEDCSFNSQGIGTYMGNEHSNPEIGERFEFVEADEIKIEVTFEKHLQNNQITGIEPNLARDNPMVKFNLVDKDGDPHEIVIRIVQIPDKF